jgi:hypothetical protein
MHEHKEERHGDDAADGQDFGQRIAAAHELDDDVLEGEDEGAGTKEEDALQPFIRTRQGGDSPDGISVFQAGHLARDSLVLIETET